MNDSPLTAGTAELLGTQTAAHYAHVVAAGMHRVAERVAAVDTPVSGVSPAELEPLLAGIDLDQPVTDPTRALDELDAVYLRDAVYFHHPRYLAHLNCPIAIPALLGEAILSAVNSSLDTWDQSTGATFIERRLIHWTVARLGLGAAADGVFTSGGTQSNLQGLYLAREEARSRTCAPLDRLRVFVSAEAHFSVRTSARLLGLPDDAVVPIRCDDARRMRVDVLASALSGCRDAGLVPMAVVATAGTTDFGSIDPLAEIAAVCARHDVWLHVDAAYGCGLLVSRRRSLLDGVERADSVTVDYHKSFFQPVSSSAVLVRDAATLAHTTHYADYLNPADGVAKCLPNQVDKSLQTTRRFDALKLWLTLRLLGADAIGAMFDDVVDRAAEAWALLRDDPRFDVVMRSPLSTVVFRYRPDAGSDGTVGEELCDRANEHARDELFASGEAVVAATRVDGRYYLKFTLLNPRTTTADVAEVLDLVACHAERFLCRPDAVDAVGSVGSMDPMDSVALRTH